MSHALKAKSITHKHIYVLAQVDFTGTLIPILVLPVQLAIISINNKINAFKLSQIHVKEENIMISHQNNVFVQQIHHIGMAMFVSVVQLAHTTMVQINVWYVLHKLLIGLDKNVLDALQILFGMQKPNNV